MSAGHPDQHYASSHPTDPPIFSTSPQSIDTFRIEHTESGLPSPSFGLSPNHGSEIEVILDDGTIQKRSVTLSTLHDLTANDGSGNPSSVTTPLLNHHNEIPSYSFPSRWGQESSADSDSSGSDEPFFPTSRRSQRERRWSDVSSVRHLFKGWFKKCFGIFSNTSLTQQQRMVLKCSFAYFIGSLFTFIPALNALIGNNRTSSHLVATATVFFNPAKTLGGMIEAAFYGWGYTSFALAICMGSMITTDYFIDNHMETIGHVVSLLFWLASSVLLVSFLKAHWNKPPVATASSLCFIIIFIIVVREGSANRGDFDTTRIEEITLAVAMGTLITVACCLLFWPASASHKLKKDIGNTLHSYRVLLKLLTKTFLLDDDLPEFKANRTLQTAIESHRASFTALQNTLHEAKLEMRVTCTYRDDYDRIVQSMERLAHSIGGLKSGCGLQIELIRRRDGANTPKTDQDHQSASSSGKVWKIRAGYRRRKFENELRRQKSTTHAASNDSYSTMQEPRNTDHGLYDNGTLAEFIGAIRSPLKSLAFTCKQTIKHLESYFGEQGMIRSPPSFQILKANLYKAISLFERSHTNAIRQFHSLTPGSNLGQPGQGGSVDHDSFLEDTFLVYFFVFNMTEFAHELVTLVETVQRLYSNEPTETPFIFWRRQSSELRERERRRPFEAFVPNERNTSNTLHTPKPTTFWRKVFVQIWKSLSSFRDQKVRYALKSCIMAVLVATPAFLDSTGEMFREWRMEWALITLMVVMTPTVGGTNLVAVYRVFSTILGCFTAACFYVLFPGNVYVLPVLTWLFSIPNFWLILYQKHGKFGQFTLLAYNLVMLNKYNDRYTNLVPVWLLAFQRCFSILMGVIIGLIATAYIWPFEARVELRKGLSDLLQRIGWLYQGLVSVYSNKTHPWHRNGDLTRTETFSSVMEERRWITESFLEHELSLQRMLLDLQMLLTQAPNEFRLKGPFPVDTYQVMLGSCQNLLDKLVAIRTAVLRDAWFEQVQHNFVIPANEERREMVGNILLYFYLLASALRLKTPLPPYFPPAHKAWTLLLKRLRELPALRADFSTEANYVFYYAYVTMMEEIVRELDKLGDSMTQLFGSLLPQDQWNELFEPMPLAEAESSNVALTSRSQP